MLSAIKVQSAQPKKKAYKLYDRDNLYFIVRPTGTKSWKFDFRLNGKRDTYSIGSYPNTSLKVAREQTTEARALVEKGIDPKLTKKLKSKEKLFSHYAMKWLEQQDYKTVTYDDRKLSIEKHLISYLDKKPVTDWNTANLLGVVNRIVKAGHLHTAKRMARILRYVFDIIPIQSILNNNPAESLSRRIPAPKSKDIGTYGRSTDPVEFAELLRLIDKPSEKQDFITTQALKLMPLVFLRPGNTRFLKWSYINFDKKMIVFPADAMKMNREFKVPLSTQALKVLKDTKKVTGDDEYVFTSQNNKPMSENTTTYALHRILKDEDFDMTSHGLRHMAKTLLKESRKYDREVIELQMAHESGNNTERAYDKAELLPERTIMMQEWADYLDQLKADPSKAVLKKSNTK